MSIENDLLWNKKLNNQNIFDLAETTHYPEDDAVISELIKILSKQSREFWKTYRDFMEEIKSKFITWNIDPDYYEQQISKAIEDVSLDATELQRAENLMKGLKYLWLFFKWKSRWKQICFCQLLSSVHDSAEKRRKCSSVFYAALYSGIKKIHSSDRIQRHHLHVCKNWRLAVKS